MKFVDDDDDDITRGISQSLLLKKTNLATLINHSLCYYILYCYHGRPQDFFQGWANRGLGTKVPQRGPRDGAPVGSGGEASINRRHVVKIMHK